MAKSKRVRNNLPTSKSIKNFTNPKGIVKNTFSPESEESSSGFAFDVSFEALYYSVKQGEFNNFLVDEKQFIDKFRETRSFIKKMSGKDFQKDLIIPATMRHCHMLRDEQYNQALRCIQRALNTSGCTNSESLVMQLLEGEHLYQIGYEGGSRYIRTYNRERKVFRLYLMDYHHKLFPDQRYNQFSGIQLKYCVMTSNRKR